MATTQISPTLLTVAIEDSVLLFIVATVLFFYAGHASYINILGADKAVFRELSSVPQAKLKQNDTVPPSLKTRNICDTINSTTGRTAVIFWGSQGGTAEAIASRYASELSSCFSLNTILADLADYNHVHLRQVSSKTLIVFVLATYGEGDPTDNAHGLLQDLRAMSGTRCNLNNVRYAIFGLGNKNYRLYNKVALDVDHHLLELGAVRVGELGLGDDSNGTTEEDFISWKLNQVPVISKEFELHESAVTYTPQTQIRPLPGLSSGAPNVYQGEPFPATLESSQIKTARTSSKLLVLPVESACELIRQSNDNSRHCVHLEFSLKDSPSIRYETGDYLQVWPINPEHEVALLLNVVGMWKSRKEVITLSPSPNARRMRNVFPSPTTTEILFRHCLEICGPVSREVMSGLVQFTSEERCKERLREVAEDQDSFRARITARRLSLGAALREVLGDDFGLLKVPLTYILDNLKRLQPRSYSISSSALTDPEKIAITALAVAEPAQEALVGNRFKGITSHYLLQLEQEHTARKQISSSRQEPFDHIYLTSGPEETLKEGKIFAQIRHSEFKLPSNAATPIIMIGSGTGVAPFRAFVQERVRLKMQGAQVGKTILIVGHRSPVEDFYYQDVWRSAREILGDDFTLHAAFSRSGKRTYVQDVLKAEAEPILSILCSESSGTIYICGSSAMARGVKMLLKNIWCAAQGADPADTILADRWIGELQNLKRLQEDSWG